MLGKAELFPKDGALVNWCGDEVVHGAWGDLLDRTGTSGFRIERATRLDFAGGRALNFGLVWWAGGPSRRIIHDGPAHVHAYALESLRL